MKNSATLDGEYLTQESYMEVETNGEKKKYPSVDIFKCDQDQTMNANHFIDWISRTCSLLRQEHGNIAFPLSATLKHLYGNFRIFSQDFNNH